MSRRPPLVGLALGSGAARGYAHLGVLQVLEAAGISIDIIAGTSIGALIAALYAQHPNSEDTAREALRFARSPEFRRTRLHALRARRENEGSGWVENVTNLLKRGYTYSTGVWRPSILTSEEIEECIALLIPDIDITELRLPYAAVATELTTGTEVIFREGSLRRAILASSAIPGIFPPVEINGDTLVDGGAVNPIPISPLKDLGAEFTIAVDISTNLEPAPDLKRSYNIYLRTLDITKRKLQRVQLQDADVVIHPDLHEVHWADFGKFKRGIALGRAAAQEALPRIQEALRHRPSRFFPFRRSA